MADEAVRAVQKWLNKTYVNVPSFVNLDYSPRYLGHEIASGRSESNVWSVANTD
ncbi:hypothetical protein KZR06_00430 [Lacticaseibacillus paracasei]|uniref:hypothetical protein n=1 Tax=Lacticaseibacillus paracasei TaxID=1597 RepID=UPI0021A8A285|nr:hypothetical protein [Lacticaseibacillus paracasei]UWP78083.1 hypothetical protein KZR06_00430 [Lacticaseibacillus paracasei]